MKRLLHLLPVQTIKSTYNLTGNADSIIDTVTGNQTQANIKSFVLSNCPITRQNIYIFELQSNFVRQNFVADDFPYTVENPRIEMNQFIFHCLPKTVYDVYLSNPVVSTELHFLHPVTIKVYNTKLIVHFTKLVKNVNHYFGEDRLARKANQTNTEADILSEIIGFFTDYFPTPLDINVGVKYLWEENDVDCYKIHYRNPWSNIAEVMNGSLTFKEKYPEEYEDIILKPLTKTVFKCLRTDDYLCKEFTTDPENGMVSVNHFADNVNQVNNVISRILANN